MLVRVNELLPQGLSIERPDALTLDPKRIAAIEMRDHGRSIIIYFSGGSTTTIRFKWEPLATLKNTTEFYERLEKLVGEP